MDAGWGRSNSVQELQVQTARRPDFFIVGAPKSGTTALYSYLAAHPDIAMSKEKEPHFFSSEVAGFQRHSAMLAQYLSNFEHAAGKRRIGEASTGYLSSRRAPEAIFDFNRCAQIIAMMRNPIDVMHALHSQRVFSGMEHIARFEVAVDSQETRYWRSGEPILQFGYREIIRFSDQIQRYFDVFGRERVHVILFDDFTAAPSIAYEKVLSYLGLPSDGRSNFEIVNCNKRVRSQAVQNWLMRLARRHRRLKSSFPSLWRGAKSIVKLNLVYELRHPIEPGFRQRLEMEYAPEVRNLGLLLGRNLDHWLAPPSQVLQTLNGAVSEVRLSGCSAAQFDR